MDLNLVPIDLNLNIERDVNINNNNIINNYINILNTHTGVNPRRVPDVPENTHIPRFERPSRIMLRILNTNSISTPNDQISNTSSNDTSLKIFIIGLSIIIIGLKMYLGG